MTLGSWTAGLADGVGIEARSAPDRSAFVAKPDDVLLPMYRSCRYASCRAPSSEGLETERWTPRFGWLRGPVHGSRPPMQALLYADQAPVLPRPPQQIARGDYADKAGFGGSTPSLATVSFNHPQLCSWSLRRLQLWRRFVQSRNTPLSALLRATARKLFPSHIHERHSTIARVVRHISGA